MDYFATGEVAKCLGITRDKLDYAIRFGGAPDAEKRCSGRKYFSAKEIENLKIWFQERGKKSRKKKIRKSKRRGNGDSA